MSETTISKIMAATEPADVAQMAMIECLRQIADNGKIANRQLEGMQTELRDVRERVIRIEATEFKAELTQNKREIDHLRKTAADEREVMRARIDKLESYHDQQTGAKGLADALAKYGPLVIALITVVFVVLVATRRLVL